MTAHDAMAEAKQAARKAAFARRKAVHDPDRDRRACANLLEFLAPHRGRPTAGYMPIRTEVDPLAAMAELAAHGEVGVPVIQGAGQPLVFHRWTPGCDLKEGPFGAKVPFEEIPVIPEVVILPLVAFSKDGFRLGYGGGFYDRTLEGLRARGPVLAVGFAYAAQKAETLPLEPTDQPLDAIVTEVGATVFSRP